MAGTRFQSRVFTILTDNGDIAPGCKAFFYLTGTSTPTPTYSQSDLDPGSENTNPVIYGADARQSVDIFLDPAVTYRVVYKDTNDNTLAEDDPVAGNDVVSGIAEHNADPDAHVDATESTRGWTQYATDTEAQAMNASNRSLTPANLAALDPLTTRPGLVERATTAEIEAGTDDERYISPLGAQDLQATAAEIITGTDTKHFMGIANWVSNWTVSGSPPEMSGGLPGGYTVKVGKRTSTQDAPETFTFAAAFSTAIYGVFTQILDPNNSKCLSLDTVTPPSVTGFTIDRDSGFAGSKDFYFIAWGK